MSLSITSIWSACANALVLVQLRVCTALRSGSRLPYRKAVHTRDKSTRGSLAHALQMLVMDNHVFGLRYVFFEKLGKEKSC